MAKWLINAGDLLPVKRKKKKKHRAPYSARMAHGAAKKPARETVAMAKAKKKKGRGSGAKRASGRKAKGLRRNPSAEMIDGRRFKLGSHRKRRAKGIRRNPSFSTSGVMSIVKDVPSALLDAGIVMVTEAATRKISAAIPIGEGNVATRILKQAGIGLAIGVGASMINRKRGYTALVGGLLTPLRTSTAMIPVVGPQVAGYGLGRYTMGAYERAPRNAAPTRREMLTGGGNGARSMAAYTANRSSAGMAGAKYR